MTSARLAEILDGAKSKRVMDALFKMNKLDVNALHAAWDLGAWRKARAVSMLNAQCPIYPKKVFNVSN